MRARAPVVSVIGSASCSQEMADLAQAVGRGLAERGAVLVCGGRGGVMEAACRGAQGSGGFTIGILPGANADEGNRYLSVALPTGLGQARNTLVALAGQAVIAIGGGEGTLSEIGLAIKAGRSVIGLETWQATAFDGRPVQITRAETPGEAVDAALLMGGE
jgi:uncharacterized protein (TIGR00725 family)